MSKNGIEFRQDIALTIGTIFKYFCISFLVVFLVGVAVRILLSPFVKSDEETDFEQKVDYILQQKVENKVYTDTLPVSSPFSPLRNLTPEQEKEICRMIKEGLPSHPKDNNKINLANVAQFITALEQLSYIDVTDKRNLRCWVEQETGKYAPPSSEFNAAFPSLNHKNVKKWKETIQKNLAEIR